MDYIQTELFNFGLYQVEDYVNPIYDPTWDSSTELESACKSVREQVSKDTKKSAPEHESRFTHWVEKYWVERGSTKYWYFRYMWMTGRKVKRKHIGSMQSAQARRKKQVIEKYISEDFHPKHILAYLDLANKE